jgi:hypothetical protein
MQDIYRYLFYKFQNYEYLLANKHMYDWECDFFCQSKAGWNIEVEVKVSRGDFLRDFKKPKHLLFRDVSNNETHHIERSPTKVFAGSYQVGELVTEWGEYSRNHRWGHQWQFEMKNGVPGEWVNDYGRCYIRHRMVDSRVGATRISIKPIEGINCPNQFYFCCPENLIRLEEIPRYAGLLYFKNDQSFKGIQIIKKAPYMHKRRQNMDSVLLSKYYNMNRNIQFKQLLNGEDTSETGDTPV